MCASNGSIYRGRCRPASLPACRPSGSGSPRSTARRARGAARERKEAQIIVAKAYEQTQALMGAGDAQATAIYAEAYEKNPELYSFLRRLETYERSLAKDTTIVLDAGSELLKYLERPGAVK